MQGPERAIAWGEQAATYTQNDELLAVLATLAVLSGNEAGDARWRAIRDAAVAAHRELGQ